MQKFKAAVKMLDSWDVYYVVSALLVYYCL